MKFKSALIVSLLLHACLGAIAIFSPARGGSGEPIYYVDLIQLGGGDGSGSGPAEAASSAGATAADKTASGQGAADARMIEQPRGGVKKLTVAKESRSALRYPDKSGRSKKEPEEEKLISVVRKTPATTAPPPSSSTSSSGNLRSGGESGGLRTGISSSAAGSGSNPGGYGGSGTGGFFPYAYYIETLRSKVSSSWYNSLVSPGLNGKFLTSVYFKIMRDGQIGDLRVEKSSGIDSLDLSALRAIEDAAPFAPLPADFPAAFLVVHFEFEWEK